MHQLLQKSAPRWAVAFTLSLAVTAFSASCGDRRSAKRVQPQATGKINGAFLQASQEFRVPYRLLLAVGFKESGMSPKPESATYLGADAQKGVPIAETAFGVPMTSLGMTDSSENMTLAPQIRAYARWLRENLILQKMELPQNPQTPSEIYDWVWHTAKLHRSGNDAKRNVQVLFARELLQQLNNGGMWQDPDSGELVELTPEPKPLVIDEFPAEIRNNLQLYTDETEIFYAQFVELSFDPPSDRSNNPTHVQVIHCPFSLSACLELQKASENPGEIRLGAHYVIPNDDGVITKALQINQHKTAITLTNSKGEPELIQDAIVIMLTGPSGRYIEGKRVQANPQWVSKNQLIALGKIIRSICPIMKRSNDAVNLDQCTKAGGDGTVTFNIQGQNEFFQWGNIPDFDEGIFRTYVNAPQALSGDASFAFANPKKVFPAKAPIPFAVNFIRGAAKVEVEYLERCPDEKVIWTGLQKQFVSNANTQTFSVTLIGHGPNHNGQHFFRTMVYDQNNVLMGWAVDEILLTDYDKDYSVTANQKDCDHFGT